MLEWFQYAINDMSFFIFGLMDTRLRSWLGSVRGAVGAALTRLGRRNQGGTTRSGRHYGEREPLEQGIPGGRRRGVPVGPPPPPPPPPSPSDHGDYGGPPHHDDPFDEPDGAMLPSVVDQECVFRELRVGPPVNVPSFTDYSLGRVTITNEPLNADHLEGLAFQSSVPAFAPNETGVFLERRREIAMDHALEPLQRYEQDKENMLAFRDHLWTEFNEHVTIFYASNLASFNLRCTAADAEHNAAVIAGELMHTASERKEGVADIFLWDQALGNWVPVAEGFLNSESQNPFFFSFKVVHPSMGFYLTNGDMGAAENTVLNKQLLTNLLVEAARYQELPYVQHPYVPMAERDALTPPYTYTFTEDEKNSVFIRGVLSVKFLYDHRMTEQMIDFLFNSRFYRPPNLASVVGVNLQARNKWYKVGFQCEVIAFHHEDQKALIKTLVVPANVHLLSSGMHRAQVYQVIRDAFMLIGSQIFEFELGQKSGLVVGAIQSIRCDLSLFQPFRGGAYILIPRCLENKRCLLNITNHDDMCGKYAFCLAAILARNGGVTPNHYMNPNKYVEEQEKYNWTGIQFPMQPRDDWDRFEKNNPFSVFIYEPIVSEDGELERIEIVRLPTNRGTQFTPIFLLLLSQTFEDSDEESFHYVTISNLSRLFNKKGCVGLVCPYCTCRMEVSSLASHIQSCSLVCESICEYPEVGQTLGFQHYLNQFSQPIQMTCDFESRMEDTIDAVTGERSRRHIPVSFALVVHNEYAGKRMEDRSVSMPNRFAFPPVVFHSANPQEVVDEMLRSIEKYAAEIKKYLSPFQRMHSAASHHHVNHPALPWHTCVVCGVPIGEDPKILPKKKLLKRKSGSVVNEDGEDEEEESSGGDEDEQSPVQYDEEAYEEALTIAKKPAVGVNRYTGEYIGSMHTSCYKAYDRRFYDYQVSVFFHNGAHYDIPLYLKYLGSSTVDVDFKKVFIIAPSKEVIKRIDMCGARVVDSLQHLNTSLEKLVERLTDKFTHPEKCVLLLNHLRQQYPELSETQRQMLCRKGEFPYSWFDSMDKLTEDRLPPMECFKSDLSGKGISQQDYDFACLVWTTFRCRSFLDYLLLYNLSDSFLLMDVLIGYRKKLLDTFHLDPAFYASLPAFGFNAMMKFTQVKFELLSDPDMVLMFEASLRGGISMASLPVAVAENKFTRYAAGDESMEEKETDSWIVNADATSLYGSTMTLPLPVAGFEWMTIPSEIPSMNEFVAACCDTEDKGALLDVDLVIPPEYHDLLNSYPPAPERMFVPETFLSTSQQLGKSDTCPKLVPHLGPRKNYVVHAHTLKLYIECGVVVLRVHRGIRYTQRPFMKSFVDVCIQMRKDATIAGDGFLADLMKLLVNACYGKFLEDRRKQPSLELIKCSEEDSDAEKYRIRKLIARNNYEGFSPIGGNLFIVSKKKKRVKLNLPIYVGSAVLDYSKKVMYTFWYKVLMSHFGPQRLELLLTDTDSTIFIVRECKDIMRELKALEIQHNNHLPVTVVGQGIFDWSSLSPKWNPDEYSKLNQKELFKFKLETGSNPILSFVGLRAKMYTLDIFDMDDGCTTVKKAAKGVPRGCHGDLDMMKSMETGEVQYVDYTKIGRKRMALSTDFARKVGCAKGGVMGNDKRFIIRQEDGSFISYALNHYATFNYF
jgi:hypothetical protein